MHGTKLYFGSERENMHVFGSSVVKKMCCFFFQKDSAKINVKTKK